MCHIFRTIHDRISCFLARHLFRTSQGWQIIVLVTTKDEFHAKYLANKLVKLKYAAAVKYFETNTIYRWSYDKESDMEVIEGKEYALRIITTKCLEEKVINYIQKDKITGYIVPELLTFKINKGSAKYLDWIGKATEC